MSVQQDDPRRSDPAFREAFARVDADRHRAASASFRAVGDEIQRREGIKVDAGRLSTDEVNELRALVAKVTHVGEFEAQGFDVRAWNVAALDRKETKTFEKLIEKGADMKGVFKERRAQDELAVELKKVGEMFRRDSRPRRPKLAGPGVVQLPAFLFEDGWLGGDNGFGVADLGVLALVLGLIDGRAEWVPGARVEGDTLVANMEAGGLGGYIVDPDQILMPRRKQLLDWLCENKLLTIEKNGADWRISRGPVLLAEEKYAVELAASGAK
jgi:hypothetical protein